MNARIPALILSLALCARPPRGRPGVEKVPFGRADGKAVDLYVLTGAGGWSPR